MEKKNLKPFAIVVLILIAVNICVAAASLYCAAKAFKNSEEAKSYSADAKSYGEEAKLEQDEIKKLIEESLGTGETKEDDVRIAGEYTIKSTTNIAEAYISGDASKLSDKDKETLQMASDVLDKIIKKDMTPYEKEKAVYEWMTKELGKDSGALLVIPTAGGEVDNPHGVLKNGNAVCVGYATTFRLFMEMLGIECKVVHNTDAYHSWDLVKLDDEWYHVDIYSDSASGNYANFNLCDGMMLQSWDREYFPAANGIKYNYFYDSMITINDIYEIPSVVRTAINEKKGGLFIKKKGEFTEADMYVANDMLNILSSCMMSALSYNDDSAGNAIATNTDAAAGTVMPVGISNNSCIVDPTDGSYILFIMFEAYADDMGNVSHDDFYEEIDKDKLNKELENSFGDVFDGINLDMPIYDDFSAY